MMYGLAVMLSISRWTIFKNIDKIHTYVYNSMKKESRKLIPVKMH